MKRRYFRAPHAASQDINARPTSRLRHNFLFHQSADAARNTRIVALHRVARSVHRVTWFSID
jgi:hypothetical protein